MASPRAPSVDVTRLRPLVLVMAAVAAGLLIADIVLRLLAGPAPAMLRAAEVLDPSEYTRIGQRVARAEEALERSSSSGRVVVVAGLSTAREDIDGARLGDSLCGGVRLLNLASSGGSYRELAFYLRTVRRTTIRSALTVVGIHPVWLAGREHASAAGTPAGDGSVRELAQRWLWLYGNRRGMHALLQNALLGARDRLADRFGLSARARYPAGGGSPWETPVGYHGTHAAPADREAQLRAWEGYGWFDASRFAAEGAEGAALREVAEAARALGGPVVFVLMPEHAELRRRSPAVALSAVRTVLASAGNPPVLDLREALPDSALFDYAHANATGRAMLSAVLPQVLAPYARCAGPASTS
jgi:hypothetical protein